MWWLNSKQLSHRAQCYVISLAWLFMCIVWWFLMLLLNISSTRNHLFLQSALNRANSCWIFLASLCLFHPPGIISFSSMTSSTGPEWCWVLLASLWLFHPPGIITFFTRALWTGTWSCCVLLAFLQLFHSPEIILVYGTKIMFVITGLPLTVPSIRNYLFLLHHILNRAIVLLDVADLLLAIPFNRNQLCPLHDAFNWPRIMFVVTDVLLTIPSTRNYHSLLLLILSTRPESHWVLLTSICLFHPPAIFSFSSMACSTGSRWYLLKMTSF